MDDGRLTLRTIALRSRVHLVSVSGELDRVNREELRRELDRVPTSTDVVVDVDGLRTDNSTALVALLDLDRRLRAAGHGLTVVCERDPAVRAMFVLAGLNIAAGHEEALRYLFGLRLLRGLRGRGAEDLHTRG